MMAAAAEDGADYLYRVNDDTQFVTPWLADAIRTLRSYTPPNVVSPHGRELGSFAASPPKDRRSSPCVGRASSVPPAARATRIF